MKDVGGCRTLTPDGKVIGSLAADRPNWATVYFYQFTYGGDPPVVDAGVGGVVAFPRRSMSLDGTVTGDGASPVTTTWSKDSGPGDVSFGDAGAVDTVAVFPEPGTYIERRGKATTPPTPASTTGGSPP